MKKQFAGHKVWEALSDATRTNFQILVTEYLEAGKISEVEKIFHNSISPTTAYLYLEKPREAVLMVTDGHKNGFRAVQKTVNISFNNNSFHQMGE